MSKKSKHKKRRKFRLSKQDCQKLLIKNATAAELLFKNILIRHHIQFEFQKICYGYIVDFFLPCLDRGLIIEIDGGIHNRKDVKKKDGFRQKNLERKGFCLIRFSNSDVEDEITILDALSNFKTRPT